MTKSYFCPHEQIRKYGAYTAWPFYEMDNDYMRAGSIPNKPAYVEYHKNGITCRKINGKWCKYKYNKNHAYYTN